MGVTVAVIGLGSIGMRHAKNLRQLGAHVWGLDPDVKKRLEIGYYYTCAKIEDLRAADAFIIASPTDHHLSDAISTQHYGKSVFMEKPIFHTLAYRPPTSHILMVGYNLRFHSCVKKAKEWLDNGIIGTPLWANFTLAQYSEKPPYLRDGVILNWSHEIDLCLYLLGKAQVRASSTRLTDGKDDISDILLTHENGCRSRIHLDYVTKPEIRGFTIVGEKGWMAADLVSRTAWRWDEKDSEEIELTEHFAGMDGWNDNYIEEMQAFLDRIEGKKTLGCTAEEAIKVLEICLEVRKQAGIE